MRTTWPACSPILAIPARSTTPSNASTRSPATTARRWYWRRVTALVVTPTAQGLGIGRQLLKEAERRARSGGASRIELTSGSQRTEAHAFYRACGYKDSSVRFVKQLGE